MIRLFGGDGRPFAYFEELVIVLLGIAFRIIIVVFVLFFYTFVFYLLRFTNFFLFDSIHAFLVKFCFFIVAFLCLFLCYLIQPFSLQRFNLVVNLFQFLIAVFYFLLLCQ